MDYEDFGNEELAKKIDERKKIIEKFINFIEDITAEIGRLVRKEVGDDHIHVIMMLENFGGFTFKTEIGQSMMGGNEVRVWHHHNIKFIFSEKPEPDMGVWYNTKSDLKELEKNVKIRYFNKELEWQRCLEYIIANRDIMVKNFKEEKNNQIFEIEKNRKKEKNREQLIKEAERLKI